MREVRQREQPGVQHVDIQVHQVGVGAALQVGASLTGLPGRVGSHRRGRGRVKVPADQFGPLAGIQLGRVEAEQHHLPGPQQRGPGTEPGQPRRPAAQHVGHAHRVGHRRDAPFGGGEVRVAVEVHQAPVTEPGQHAERDGAVAAQDQRQPPVGADRRHLARDPLGHLDDPVEIAQAVDRQHRTVRRRGEITAVFDIQASRAQLADQPGGPPRGRGLFLPGIVRTRAGRNPQDAHPPILRRHPPCLQVVRRCRH